MAHVLFFFEIDQTNEVPACIKQAAIYLRQPFKYCGTIEAPHFQTKAGRPTAFAKILHQLLQLDMVGPTAPTPHYCWVGADSIEARRGARVGSACCASHEESATKLAEPLQAFFRQQRLGRPT
jgi:hypothetical protein